MAKRSSHREIEIDEIFPDRSNAPGFHQENMEGVIENPIKKEVFWVLGAFLTLALTTLGLRAAFLQVVFGDEFYERSENNRLRTVSMPAERGMIYDRAGTVLAYNNEDADGKIVRKYPEKGFLHVLGYLGYFQEESLRGISGLEAIYNDVLAGVPGKKIEEVDAKGTIVGSGILAKGEVGQNLLTSLSGNLQIRLAEAISSTMRERGFTGGAGVFIDVNTGEILALVSLPEFDPNSLSLLADKLLNNEGKPFLNRAISGLYPPGSVVKPALAVGALAEQIITPDKKILSTGSIVLPNPYDPEKPNVFLDWKAHGLVDMRRALAVSSDVYFYTIGGGYQNQPGLGAWNIKKYLSMFGFGEFTGIDLPGEKKGHIPDPSEKQEGRNWTVGDTYHVSIGQGGMVTTPLQIAVYAATIASGGVMPYPHVIRALVNMNKQPVQIFSYPSKQKTAISADSFQIIKEGMREAVQYGTAVGFSALPFEVAAKTGTAEIGNTNKVHSWSMGFFPYDAPKIAFAVLMESGPRANTIGATYAASNVLEWMAETDFLNKLKNDILLTNNQ